jgi:hypothetical protein
MNIPLESASASLPLQPEHIILMGVKATNALIEPLDVLEVIAGMDRAVREVEIAAAKAGIDCSRPD